MVITNSNEDRVTKIDTYLNAAEVGVGEYKVVPAEKLRWVVGDDKD